VTKGGGGCRRGHNRTLDPFSPYTKQKFITCQGIVCTIVHIVHKPGPQSNNDREGLLS
jgi:hypothetical protein